MLLETLLTKEDINEDNEFKRINDPEVSMIFKKILDIFELDGYDCTKLNKYSRGQTKVPTFIFDSIINAIESSDEAIFLIVFRVLSDTDYYVYKIGDSFVLIAKDQIHENSIYIDDDTIDFIHTKMKLME